MPTAAPYQIIKGGQDTNDISMSLLSHHLHWTIDKCVSLTLTLPGLYAGGGGSLTVTVA